MVFGARVTIKKSILLLSMVWGFFYFVGTNQSFSQPEDFNSTISSLIISADSLRVSGQYGSAREVLNEALNLANEQEEKSTIAKIHNQLGVLGIYEYKFLDALSNLQTALTIYKEIQDDEGIAECLNNMASIHITLTNYEQAKEKYKQSLQIRESGNDLEKIAVSYNNLGLVFNRMNEQDSALFYQHQALGLWESLSVIRGIGITLNHIGNALRDQGELEGALMVFEESLEKLSSDTESYFGSIELLKSDIGQILSMLGRNEEAIQWCMKLCFGIDGGSLLVSRRNCCKALYQAYSNLEDNPQALSAYKKYIKFKDSILGTQSIQQITKLELNYAFDQIQQADSMRFETERQLSQERINKQRLGLVTIGGILLLLSLLIVVIARGKKRTEELLLNILPAAVAKELKQTGTALPQKYHSVSVVFADIKGFTQISENLSPEDLLKEINIYFTAFDLIMDKYGMEKIKTIGDCYMAASGLPIEREDHALTAVSAALEMQDFMKTKMALKKANKEPFFEIRIGIHSGPVVAGIVGTRKFQYDIWGDTVNTANRLETNSEVGKVNVSETTFSLVKDHFKCTYRGEIDTKGKGSVSMYYVESA